MRVTQLGEGQHEVVVDLNIDAKAGENQVFLVELAYGDLFQVANIPQESLQPVLLVECRASCSRSRAGSWPTAPATADSRR